MRLPIFQALSLTAVLVLVGLSGFEPKTVGSAAERGRESAGTDASSDRITGATVPESGNVTLSTFSPQTPGSGWVALARDGLVPNGSTVANVHALVAVGTDIYVGGFFNKTKDGSVTNLNGIAKYNTLTKTWSALPNKGLTNSDDDSSLVPTVHALAVIGTDLYVGGEFNQTADHMVKDLNGIARFSLATQTWSALPQKGLAGFVYALAVNGGDLYVGGGFNKTKRCTEVGADPKDCNENGQFNHIARFNGGSWFPLAQKKLSNDSFVNGLDGQVYALAFLGDDLYIGGAFNETREGKLTNLHNVAKFLGGLFLALPNKGLIFPLSGGSSGTVEDMAVIGDDLYVVGGFGQTGDGSVSNMNGVARLRSGSWSALPNRGLCLGDPIVPGPQGQPTSVFALGSDLYVGGNFNMTCDATVADLGHVAKFGTVNETWSDLPNNGLNGDVNAFTSVGSSLFVAGSFTDCVTNCGKKELGGIAKVGLSTKVELIGIEVTQGIQNWRNDVPLIDHRSTYVRVFLQNTDPTSIFDLEGRLSGTRDGKSLGPSLAPITGSGTHIPGVGSPLPLFRARLVDSFQFRLPQSWLAGSVELRFTSPNYDPVCKEVASSPNDCKALVTFTAPMGMVGNTARRIIPRMRFVFFPWKDSSGTVHQPTLETSDLARKVIVSMLPVSDLNYRSVAVFRSPFVGAPDTKSTFAPIDTALEQRAAFDGCSRSAGCRDYYVGILVDHPGTGDRAGHSYVPDDEFVAYVDASNPMVIAHEFGHALGREHTNCNGKEGDPDKAYPYAGGLISPISDTQDRDSALFGFDTINDYVYLPSDADLMSYCRPRWISDWTYNQLKQALVAKYQGSASSKDNFSSPAAAEPAILVSGTISSDTPAATISSVYQITVPVDPPSTGSYTIRLENSSGQVQASYPFEPESPIDEKLNARSSPAAADTLPFVLLLPRSPGSTRIVIAKGAQILATQTASAQSPSVSINFPNGGETLNGSVSTFRWTAGDGDGNALAYTVQYSTDAGSSWQTLTTDHTSTSLDVDLSLLPGTTQGLLRIIATDGFNTTQAQSAGLFSVAKHAPFVAIDGPRNDTLYIDDQVVFLEGTAYDLEDGLLEDNAFTWTSNRNGVLGTGRSLEISAADLAAGTHLITVTGKDSDGQTGSRTFIIYVYRVPRTVNAIDDVQFFVSQHYLDFLDRTFDLAGFDFWTSQLTSCGSDPQCAEVKRINVSASYFLSIEFQQTGYLVERTYKASFGDTTAASTIPSPHQISVPALRFDEFIADTQKIRKGVVVLQPGWELLLESNKQAFFLSFVQGPRFTSALPTTMTPAQFVDQLNLKAGNVLSSTERATALALFGGASDTSNIDARARALRLVAEDQDLYNSEFSRAFVLMQYFGYLRRNPNDLPDNDYTGYDFWLTKLNKFNGNYVAAEMVKAFLSSIEYRQRFSP